VEVLVVPSTIKILSPGSFINIPKQDQKKIRKVVLHNCIEIIDGAFDDWESLEDINLPQGLKKIGEYSFRCCSNLKNIVLPYGLREIGNQAFRGCVNLEKL